MLEENGWCRGSRGRALMGAECYTGRPMIGTGGMRWRHVLEWDGMRCGGDRARDICGHEGRGAGGMEGDGAV